MTFIRVKKRIKGQKTYFFAYEVENKWYKRKKSTRQRVKRYLGRVYTVEEKEYQNFFGYLGVDEDGFISYSDRVRFEEMSLDLIEFELLRHGFVQGVGRQRNRLLLDDFTYDMLRHKLYSQTTKKPIVLEMNEGFMCDLSIRQMLRFRRKKYDDNRVMGKDFAKAVLSTGIKVEPDIFVELFEKLKEN